MPFSAHLRNEAMPSEYCHRRRYSCSRSESCSKGSCGGNNSRITDKKKRDEEIGRTWKKEKEKKTKKKEEGQSRVISIEDSYGYL